MARIKNMGTATMSFNEGVIVKGEAGTDEHALIVSGSVIIKDTAGIYSDKIRRSSDSDTTTKILLNDELLKFYAGDASEDIVRIGDTNKGSDNNFWVSGSIDSKGTANAGTAVFGGDVVVSGSLIAKQLLMTSHKFNRSDANEFALRWDAAGSNRYTGNTTSGNHGQNGVGENNNFIAPAHGKLKFAVFRTRKAAGDTKITLFKSSTGWNVRGSDLNGAATNDRGFETQLNEVELLNLAAETAYKFIFTDAASFQFGDTLAITIDPENDPDYGNLTCIWEYDFVRDGV